MMTLRVIANEPIESIVIDQTEPLESIAVNIAVDENERLESVVVDDTADNNTENPQKGSEDAVIYPLCTVSS